MNLDINNMSFSELKKLKEELTKAFNNSLKDEFVLNELNLKNFNDNGKYLCNHCGSFHTHKYGKNIQGKQRYKCLTCNKVMISQQEILTFSTKKDFSQWISFLDSLLNGDSLDLSAKKSKISKSTARRWRYKILAVLHKKLNKVKLSGTIYLDETLFSNIHKDKTKSTIDIKLRGMSNQKLNVTCAIDKNHNSIIKVLDSGRVTSKSLINAYDTLIDKDSIVVSDSLRSYHQLMEHLKVRWKKIPSKKKSIEKYDLQPINHYHALIKDFFYKYKGISYKYLEGYLALFDYRNKNRDYHNLDKLIMIIKDIFTTKSTLRCVDIDDKSFIFE
ncbi:transposase-like protein [Bacilli bacterium PM5-3]|nr:transposase-like protein [Bacilli bacterium PM5-3]